MARERLVRCMMGPVDGLEGKHCEEGVLPGGRGSGQEVEQFVRIEFARKSLGSLDERPVAGEGFGRGPHGGRTEGAPIVGATRYQRQGHFEAAVMWELSGFFTEMPFSEEASLVASRLEKLAQSAHALVQMSFVARLAALIGRHEGDHVSESSEMTVDSRHQHRAAWRAGRGGVEIREDHAIGGQPVDIRCWDLAAEGADISPAEVVGDDDQYVRLDAGWGDGRAALEAQCARQDEEEQRCSNPCVSPRAADQSHRHGTHGVSQRADRHGRVGMVIVSETIRQDRTAASGFQHRGPHVTAAGERGELGSIRPRNARADFFRRPCRDVTSRGGGNSASSPLGRFATAARWYSPG